MKEKSLNPILDMRGLTRLLCLIAAIFVSTGAPSWGTTPVSSPTDREAIFFARGFKEPLVPMSATSADEDKALSRALKSYRETAGEYPFRPLEQYLAEHPQSGWRVALLTNLGLSYYYRGYFSKTIEVLEKAWTEGRAATELRAKALVDRAVGELLWMHARLGHSERVAALLEDIGDRPLTGPATELLTGAKEGLSTMQNEPGVAYLCGPMALKNLLLVQGTPPDKFDFLDLYRSGTQGVSLAELGNLAARAELSYRLVHRKPTEPVPVPSIVHWKVNHFAAIVDERDGQFQIEDPTFGEGLSISRAAIDAEASGYFLVFGDKRGASWRDVSADEASRIRGMGITADNKPDATTPSDDKSKRCRAGGSGFAGMCAYNFTEMMVSLNLNDQPVGYAPPKGPPVYTRLTYNQREASQPANFNFFNVSPKWSLNWLSYIEDNPAVPGGGAIGITRYVAGGGKVKYPRHATHYDRTTGTFAPETRDGSILVRIEPPPGAPRNQIAYKRQLADGSTEIYHQSDGSPIYPRHVFLSQLVDPAGNAVTLNYDNRLRLISILDATGRLTTFSYDLPRSPWLITRITDPFGRSAHLEYDSSDRLSKITDVIGINSQFHYDAASLINSMTTPYGTTTFDFGDINPLLNKCQFNPQLPFECNGRFVQATDPLGNTERLEYRQKVPGDTTSFQIPASDPTTTVPNVPQVFARPNNQYLDGRNTFYWDQHAYQIAAGDYTKTRNKHWVHNIENNNETGDIVESIKYPLESRIWFNYPGQTGRLGQGAGVSGTLDKPIAIARVLDDGNMQLTQLQYNDLGNVTSVTDPVGRNTLFNYAANQIDITAIGQHTMPRDSTLARFTYNSQHLPTSSTGADGKTTSYTYNNAGQLIKMRDALGHTTTYQYDGTGNLRLIGNANGAIQASFTYDGFGRVATRTDSEGHTVRYTYDAMDRIVEERYPDDTTQTYTWSKLDLVLVKDRQGRVTRYTYDAVRNLTSITDPLGNTMHLGYHEDQKLKNLTDPNGNTTTWDIDIEGRVTAKHYADGSAINYQFENTTSRLKSITDAAQQLRQYTYALDDRIIGIDYQNAANPTPNVRFLYDAFFPLMTYMIDGVGTTKYRYHPVGSLGALQIMSEDGPFANDIIDYEYDELGRIVRRTIGGSSEAFTYDALGRLISETNDLGLFSMSYLGQTRQITALQNGTVGTNWTYGSNLSDRRLQSIANTGMGRSYQYITTPENIITAITETGGIATGSGNWTYGYDAADRLLTAQSSATTQYAYAYDPAGNLTMIQNPGATNTLTPNSLNQIGSLNGNAFSYDANGNLVHDDQHTYQWDAENRLVEIGYNAQPSKQTTMRYDGFGRRIAITTTDGGLANETRYLWCGETLCQARNANDVVMRRFFAQGEEITSPGALLYYARDHLGSVRDLLVSQNGNGVASYDFDPYGAATRASGQISSSFRYAGMFYHDDSGLYLARYRAYSPRLGKWLSRDPLGEGVGINLSTYVRDDSVNLRDPLGLKVVVEGARLLKEYEGLKQTEYGPLIAALEADDEVLFHIRETKFQGKISDLKWKEIVLGETRRHLPDWDKNCNKLHSEKTFRVDFDSWVNIDLVDMLSESLQAILVHELFGHAVPEGILGQDEKKGYTAAQLEAEAMFVENKFRNLHGLPQRP